MAEFRVLISLLASWTAVLVAGSAQGQVTPPPVITDVTPSGFSVVWSTANPENASLAVFSDAAATNNVTSSYRVVAYPLFGTDLTAADPAALRDAADALVLAGASRGLVKIRVENVPPQTNLFVHPQASGSNLLATPLAVITEDKNSFVSASNQLVVKTLSGPSEGALVTVSSGSTRHPVTALIGDGAPNDTAFVNLNHLFDAATTNWQPVGPTPLTITVRFSPDDIASAQEVISFSGDFTVGQTYLINFGTGGGGEPSITLIDPSIPIYSRGRQILVSWTDDTGGGSGTVSLFADTDNVGNDGVPIVGGLAGLPDGTSDQFVWDTSTFNDGAYFVYAVIDNGSQQATSYSTGQVTVDNNGISADGDPMSDLFEDFYFGDRTRDGSGDFDSDGETDADEAENDTNPTQSDVRLALSAGLNIVAFPFTPDSGLMASDLLNDLAPNALSLGRINKTTGLVETATFSQGSTSGSDFPIMPGEGYFLEMAAEAEAYFTGTAWNGQITLASGEIVAKGFKAVPETFDAYTLLQSLGGSSVVESIRTYDPTTGRYQTASYFSGNAIGQNFPIHRGGAYLISVSNDVTNFTP